jgi:hypothetical protein
MKLSVLYYPHREGHNSIFPLLAFQKAIENNGISIRFFKSKKEFINSKPNFYLISGVSLPKLTNGGKDAHLKFLKGCHERGLPVIYLSGSDSVGPFDKDILGVVDSYLMRQLLVNKDFYLKPHRRFYFRDKYFEKFFFRNQDEFPLVQYSIEEVKKLGVYWNLGLIDWKTQTSSKLIRYYHILTRNTGFKTFTRGKDLKDRKIDLSFRGNLFPNSHDVSRFHRLQTYRNYRKSSTGRVVPKEGFLAHSEFMKEMGDTKICLSPFGWGEVCYRDFEAFQMRTLLFKPDMSHLETFPNLYLNSTCISYDWEATTLLEKSEEILNDIEKYQVIADAGHDLFNYFSSEITGGGAFVTHLKGILKNAEENFSLR